MTASAVDAVNRAFENIERWNATLNALLEPSKECATEQALAIDQDNSRGVWRGILAGMTVSIKDNIDWVGTPTTAASPLYKDRFPTTNAFVVDRLLEHGAVIVGKANLHELVFGPTSQSTHYGPVKNPWNTLHIAGGSSGGSGASVASGMCQVSIGSDTAGSIRIPAAFNGVCGLRPTSGRVSNRGSIAVSAKFDALGPLARRIEDIARVFYAIAQYDREDVCCEPFAAPPLVSQWDGIGGMRIGMPVNFFFEDVSAEISRAVRQAANVLKDLGAQIVPIELHAVEQSQEMLGFRIILADAYNLYRERLHTQPEAFGDDLKIRFEIGRNVSGWEYANAMRWVEQWRHTLKRTFEDVDAILTPTIPSTAPAAASVDFARAIRSIPRFTCAYAAAGVPSLAMPCGIASDGLPMSLQLAATWANEADLFRIGAAYQSVTDHHLKEPAMQ